MPNDPYRELARQLDAIPNGFPATASGVELRLLAKLFAPEEAALAAVMRLTPEPAGDIASRARRDSQEAYRTLRSEGSQKNVVDAMQTRAELYDFLGYHAYEDRLDALFKARKG